MLVMAARCRMTDHVFIPFNGRVLALDTQTFQDALQRGDELMGTPQQNTPHTAPDLLTAEQMAEKTNVPASWWLEAAKSGRVPSVRYGKYVRFPASILTVADGLSAAKTPGKQATARLSAVKD